MNHQAQLSITEMLNGFGRPNQDFEVFLLTLDRLCAGLSDQAIIETADRFGRGDVKDQSKDYPPSSARFIEEARLRQEYLDLKARPRLAPPTYPRGPLAPFEIARQKALARHSNRPVLMENIGLDEFKRLCAAKQLPLGSIFACTLGIVYGAENKHEKAA